MVNAASPPLSADIALDSLTSRSPSWLDSAHLARAIALAFALAAALLAARLDGLFADQWLFTIGMPLLLVLATAALVLLQDRLPLQRSVSAWLLWTLGGAAVALLAAAAVVLLAAAAVVQQTGADALAAALAAALAWAAAIALNGREAARAFARARRLAQIRSTLFGLSAAGCIGLGAWAVADKLAVRAGVALARTPIEALAPGIGIAAGLIVALALAAVALRMPRQMAQWQLEGRISASAAGEAMWFAALLPLLMPLALPQAWPPGFGNAVALPADAWGDAALRSLGVAIAHGLVRLWLGAAGSSAPQPLLLLLPPGAAPPVHDTRLRDTMATLPLQWRSGPVIRLMPPADAVAHGGAHLRLAALLGITDRLFPRCAQDMAAWRQQVPAGRCWRALPAQEIYAEPAHFADVLRTLVDAQTWVLCVDDGPNASSGRAAWIDALPPGRTVRLDFSGSSVQAETGAEQTLWRSRPVWTDGLGPPLPAWLRGRLQPLAPRRIAIAHGPDDAALAQAIVAALDGRHDEQGRPVEAWAMPQNLGSLRRLPLNGFRTMLASSAVPSPQPAWLWRRVARLTGADQGQDAGRFELAWLLGRSGQAAAGAAPTHAALAAAAVRRIALRQDAAVEPPAGLDGQIDAGAGSALPADQAAWFAQRLLREEWVGLAPPAAPGVPKAPTADPASPPPTRADAPLNETPAPASPDTARPVVFISFHASSNSRAIAHALAQQLRAALPGGVDLFLADELPEGEPVAAAITSALQRCTHFVPLLCDEYWTRSKACREELFTAVAAFEQSGHPKLLPVLVDRVDDELFELGLPRQMGELRSAQPILSSLAELAFAGPLDEAGQPQPMERHAGEKRSAQIEQVAQHIRGVLLQQAPAAQADAESPPPSSKAAAAVFDFGQAVRSLVRLDDQRLVVGLDDGRIAIWRPDDEEPPQLLSPPAGYGAVNALCGLPASLGTGFVSAGTAGRLLRWSAAGSGFEARAIGAHDSAVKAMCLADDAGAWVVAGDEQGRISWWPLATGSVPPRHHAPLGVPVEALDSEGDRLFVALGSGGLQTLQWGEAFAPAAAGGDQAHAVQQMGDNLYAGGQDTAGRGRIQRIKLRSGGLDPRVISGMPAIVTAMAVLPDDTVAVGLADGSISCWDPSAGANMLCSEPRHEGAVLALAAWPDGRVCSAGLDGRVVVKPPPRR